MELSQGLADHGERLVEALLALFELHAEAQELVRLVAAPEAELEPPAAQAVDHRRLLHDADRMVLERQDDHAGAQTDPARLAGGRRGHEEAVRHERVAGEVVLGEPAGPVPELVHEAHLGELLLVALLARLALPPVAEDEMGEVHRVRVCSPIRSGRDGETM